MAKTFDPDHIVIPANAFGSAVAAAVLLRAFPDAALWISGSQMLALRLGELAGELPKRRRSRVVWLLGQDPGADPARVREGLRPLVEGGVRVRWILEEPAGPPADWPGVEWIAAEASLAEAAARAAGVDVKAVATLLAEVGPRRSGGDLESDRRAFYEDAVVRYRQIDDPDAVPAAITALADVDGWTERWRSSRAGVDKRRDLRGRVLTGSSPVLRRVKALVRKLAADGDAPVRITGETGTGKEAVAWILHHRGPRADRPFVAVNCAALPESLLDSELFGYVKGAFTGADRNYEGLIAAADGGTLFLDEIADMSATLQAKMLRVLQEGEVRPLGRAEAKRVNVRVIVASHRDLAEAVRSGRFRADLFYRLDVLRLEIPPLRARPEDIRQIAEDLLRRMKDQGRAAPRLTPDLVRAFEEWPWPGNVRELQAALARMRALQTADPDLILGAPAEAGQLADCWHHGGPLPNFEAVRIELAEAAMARHTTQAAAAAALGIDRATLRGWLAGRGRADD